MGFGSFFKKEVLGKLPGADTGVLDAFGLVGAKSGAESNERDARGGLVTESKQFTAGNVFKNLTPEQQKDILINNPNIVTAQGRQFFDPETNTITLEESGFQEAQRGRQEALAAGLSGQLGGALPDVGFGSSDTFQAGKALLEPGFQQERERLEQQLADQGLPPGSEAFNEQISRLEASQGRQLSELSLSSIQTAEAQRSARFNEISSLLGTQQVGGVGFSQFQPQSSGLDLFGAEQSGLQRQFQAEQARKQRSADQRAALISGAGKVGSAAIGLSDARLKENIEEVGVSDSGIPIYHFEYINKEFGEHRYSGVMAQDLEALNPEAIHTLPGGIMAVDYDKIDVDFKRVK